MITYFFPVVPSEEGNGNLTHSPKDVIEQFISNPSSFLAFLEENYLSHFSCTNDVDKAASALSDGDFMLAEWRVSLKTLYRKGTRNSNEKQKSIKKLNFTIFITSRKYVTTKLTEFTNKNKNMNSD